MRSFFAVLAILWLGVSAAWAGNVVVPSTTLAAETGNNTSSSATFATQSNGNLGQANISKVSTRTLFYAGSSTPIYAHFMGWFGGSNHMNVGYTSSDPAQVKRQVTDALSRGIGGFIEDWYGPNNAMPNNTALALKAEAASRGGAFGFAIMYDGGALASCHATVNCDLTQQAIQDLTYSYQNFETSPAYIASNGRPLVFFFDPDRYGTLNWPLIAASVPGNPLFIFRNAGGFTHSSSAGSFSWVIIDLSNPNDWSQSYLDNFYQTGMSYPSEYTFGAAYKGFNDSLAAWGSNRIMNQQCGQTWLNSIGEQNKFYSSTKQLPGFQIVTWNDYEEGSEIETGIDNCVNVSASVSGNSLSWGITGSQSAIDHYTVFISTDGANLMPLANLPASAVSYDLGAANMNPGSYIVYVEAVGKPSLTNKMSPPATYTVAAVNQPPVAKLTVSPGSGAAPLGVTASTAGSSDTDGTITASRINFGDGTVVSGATASHTYQTAGRYTVTGTVTDNSGASSSTTFALTSYGVKVTSPANGATLASPVHVVGSAYSAHPITYMRIYVDNVSVYGAAVASVNTYVSLAAHATHHIVVQSWDSTGLVYKTGVYVTVP